LEIIKGQAKELKKEVNFIKQEFQVQMGDAEQAICSDKLINWKSQHKKSYVVQESDSRVMRIGKYKVNGGK